MTTSFHSTQPALKHGAAVTEGNGASLDEALGPPDRLPPSMPRRWWKINGRGAARVTRPGTKPASDIPEVAGSGWKPRVIRLAGSAGKKAPTTLFACFAEYA